MENYRGLIKISSELAGFFAAQPAETFPAAVIDLTEEDAQPSIKNRLGNNREVIPVPIYHSPQPGTSRQLLGARPKKRGGCTKCGNDTSAMVHLDCQHRLCMGCFILTLRSNRTTVNSCPIPDCQSVISDIIIRSSLNPSDYIYYLEHIRDNLRNALKAFKAKDDANRLHHLETIDERIELEIPQIIEVVRARPLDFLIDPTLPVNLMEPAALPDTFSAHEAMTITKRRSSWLVQSQNLDNQPFWNNVERFECSICLTNCEVGDGVMLKNCLHSFCKECISDTIRHSTDPAVLCPGFNADEVPCELYIQDREIRALTPPEVYEQFLQRALKQGETNLDNVLHCKTPDCIGFVQTDADATAFVCQVCDAINCIKCKAIHELKTCEEYQFDLLNDVKNQKELQMTEQAVTELIAKGEVSERVSKLLSLNNHGLVF